MKEKNGEAPATIAGVRALGGRAVLVTCNAPCRRSASVLLDTLRLPDDTPFAEIGTRRRLVCKECGRRAARIEVDWKASSERGAYDTWGMMPPG